MATWVVLLTIGLPWLGGVCVWLVGDERPRAQHALASCFAVVGGLVSLALLGFVDQAVLLRIPVGGSTSGAFGDFTLVADGLGVYLAIIAAVIGGLAVIFSNAYMETHSGAQLGRYYALTMLFIGAMIGLVLSGGLLLMFIFWEITAFCSYALISFHNDDPKAVAGGIKALIITQLGGVGLLAGGLLSYAYLGSYEISVFLERAQNLPPGILGLMAFGFLAAAIAKSAQVPLHTWLPDAMEAPTPISALIHAATMVNAGVYLLARFYPAFEAVPGWRGAVLVVGLLSALLAGLMAVVCNDLKRTLAYSTISQLGYMIYAIGVGAILASQFHLFSHSVFKALLFLGAGAVIHTVGTRDMLQMGGLGARMPFVRAVFVIGALALAGLPITNGFFSKELILEGGMAHGPVWAFIGMLIGAAITGLYTIRMVVLVFGGKERRDAQAIHSTPLAMRVPLFILAFGTLTTWLLVGPFARLLADSLPFHHLHADATPVILAEVITAPATWIALLLILAGMASWLLRDRFASLIQALRPFRDFLDAGMGFEWLNRQVINLTQASASELRRTQTGLLAWNVAGIAGGLILLLVLVVIGR
ncbi:MAG: NADH-quinone oxidoreductase subunit L [Anaerolineales bacterium]|nr:NADH-quinone oxidoreductase subunit L [Anaerolineales bacterium]